MVSQESFRRPSRGYWHTVGRRLSRDPVAIGCAVILLAIIALAIAAPWLGLDDPYKMSMIRRLKPPGYQGHLLGTDELGRDMLSRLIYGGRLSLFTGFAPVVLATLIGGTLGIAAGFAGGRWNMVIMRLIDVFYAFPSVLLAVAISGALGAGLLNSLVSLTLVFIPPIARIAESITTQVREQDFVEAARATGASALRVVRGHVLSNVIGPILVYASSLISVSIVIASGLSFLGLGVNPPNAEWGLMLNTLRQAIYVTPLNAILPGIMIFVTSMCFNLMSDGLRSAMDVKA
ncbi:ABC transporter permease [Bordetella genomosp. 11]|nr:ABC transporter permease [Bordetella genomosp. 11]